MGLKYENNSALQFAPGTTVSFDAQAFDDSIRSQGARLIHYRAMRCPVGMIDKDDLRRPHDDHQGCSNGFIYIKAGCVTCLFTGNSDSMRQLDIGLLDGSTVQSTAPRFYDDCPTVPVEVAPFDRFFLVDEAITVPHWELVQAHETGRDRLHFQAESVTDVIDSRGHVFGPNDFTIQQGQIVWGPSAGPGIDPSTGKGRVYSIRYHYKPHWYVSRVMHQVRIAQVETALDRQTMRFPHSFLLQREYVFLNEDKDDQAKNPESPRQVKGPGDGINFGPR